MKKLLRLFENMCKIPDENISPTYETVISIYGYKYQNHKHNSYYMRTKKTETNIYRKSVRFSSASY